MNRFGWAHSSTQKSRQGRSVAALVERLESRSLLTLQFNPIATTAGEFFNVPVATFSAGDVQGTLADFQATTFWPGASSLTTGGFIAPNGPGNYIIYSSNVYGRPGSYPVNVVLTGANDSTAQASGTATVTDAPLSTSPTTIFPQTQTLFSGTVATFQTNNSFATPADFKASIDWGDGSGPTPGTISRDFFFSSFSVVGQHTYRTVGTLPVTVTITSPGGQTNIVSSTAIISALPVSVFPTPVTGNAREPLTGVTVATFLDPYITDVATDFRATIDWGDGTINVGTIVGQGDGVFSVAGSHTYAASGNYNINVQVVRVANGQTASTSNTAQIGSPSPTLAFTGGLAAVPANGAFISSGFAATNRPTFGGTSTAFAIVELFARPSNVDANLPLGETVADANGHWSLTTGPLAPGSYLVTAKVTPPAGYPSLMMTLTSNNGTFFIGLSPSSTSSSSQPAAAADATNRHVVRSRNRHVAVHRTPKGPRASVARWVSSGARIRPRQ